MASSTRLSRLSITIPRCLIPSSTLLMMGLIIWISGLKRIIMLKVLDLGSIEYEQAWKLQDQYAAEIAQGKRPPTLLLLEHPHVYTFGRRGKQENLLWGESQLKEKGIAIHWVDRGGDVTYHGPGQLVGYPLMPLRPVRNREASDSSRIPDADYVGYVRRLEKTLIIALARLGLAAGQRSGLTGVW